MLNNDDDDDDSNNSNNNSSGVYHPCINSVARWYQTPNLQSEKNTDGLAELLRKLKNCG